MWGTGWDDEEQKNSQGGEDQGDDWADFEDGNV